jgi:ribose transport system ATP-binding protein
MTTPAEPATIGSERLRMTGVRKRFGATVALGGVDLFVNAGEVLALVGENGAGKSTLMKVLSGAHLPDAGEMWLDGQPYRPRNPLDARRAGVAMIYQELSLARHLSVAENILLGMEPTHGAGILRWPEIRRIAGDALVTLGRPDIPLDIPVARLSVAEQQLVEIGRAVAVGCRVLVLDEPTSSLTKSDIAKLFELVRRLKSQGHGIVYISHFLEEVKEISDRYTVLRDGQSVGGGPTASATSDQIIALMVGRQVEDLYPRSNRTVGDVILEVSHLSAAPDAVSTVLRDREEAGAEGADTMHAAPQPLDYASPGTSNTASGGSGGVKLRRASLQLRRGEVLGIAGLVGAGRTELLRSLFGLNKVRSGQVRLAAYSGLAAPARRWAQGMGMVSEDRKAEGLALNLSIADNLTMSSLPVLTSPAAQAAASMPWIRKIPIKCSSPFQSVGALSGGNQQKVAIARLLHHDVDVLLLDEPTRGIDVGSKAQIYQNIDELACAGKAVVIVSSYLPELMGVCDRIAVMCRGVLGPARPVAEVTEHQIMLEATGSGDCA